jgi:hypothetical protein
VGHAAGRVIGCPGGLDLVSGRLENVEACGESIAGAPSRAATCCANTRRPTNGHPHVAGLGNLGPEWVVVTAKHHAPHGRRDSVLTHRVRLRRLAHASERSAGRVGGPTTELVAPVSEQHLVGSRAVGLPEQGALPRRCVPAGRLSWSALGHRVPGPCSRSAEHRSSRCSGFLPGRPERVTAPEHARCHPSWSTRKRWSPPGRPCKSTYFRISRYPSVPSTRSRPSPQVGSPCGVYQSTRM